jgi:hypothetical protein
LIKAYFKLENKSQAHKTKPQNKKLAALHSEDAWHFPGSFPGHLWLVLYLWVQHKLNGIDKLIQREVRNRNWWWPHTLFVNTITPKWLVTKEWDNCCWALQVHVVKPSVLKKNSV